MKNSKRGSFSQLRTRIPIINKMIGWGEQLWLDFVPGIGPKEYKYECRIAGRKVTVGNYGEMLGAVKAIMAIFGLEDTEQGMYMLEEPLVVLAKKIDEDAQDECCPEPAEEELEDYSEEDYSMGYDTGYSDGKAEAGKELGEALEKIAWVALENEELKAECKRLDNAVINNNKLSLENAREAELWKSRALEMVTKHQRAKNAIGKMAGALAEYGIVINPKKAGFAAGTVVTPLSGQHF
jgi:hypothetical protein